MSGFLYFVDGFINPLTAERISEFGLGYAFERLPQWGKIDGRTPSGGAGTLACDESRMGGSAMAYRPDQQTWRKLPRPAGSARPDVYVGFWDDAKPTAATLARAKQLPGDYFRFAGSGTWLVPRLRMWADESGFVSCLPGRAGIDDSGNWVITSQSDEVRELNELADRLYAAMFSALAGQATPFTVNEGLDTAAKLLSVNYVVSKFEIGMLEMLPTDADLIAVCRIAMDYDSAEAWAQKKTEELAQAVDAG